VKAAGLCVLIVAGLTAPPAEFVTSVQVPSASRTSFAPCTAPPAPGVTTRTVPDGHAKPSALAPHPRSRNRAYGAPIPRPIVRKHARRARHAGSSPPK
jgi:hypothetical protein